MPIITRAQIARLAPHAIPAIVAGFADHADDVLPRYGLATRARVVDFMAHCLEETGGFTVLEENLHYSAARLCQVWPSRFPSFAAAAPYAGNPRALADKVYGGRMGNTGPDDGWTFRGQGPLQTTGRANCTALAKHMGKTVAEVLAMLTSEAGMLECAAASYVMTGAPKFADAGDIEGSTRAVNGGLTNLDRRKAYRVECLKAWPGEIVVPPRAAVIATMPKPAPAIATSEGMPTFNKIVGAINAAAAGQAPAAASPPPAPCTRADCPLRARTA